jgi:5-methylcytosine-specific restriction protein A
LNREVILPKIHENLLEYIGRPKRIYTTEYIYTCLLEFITQDDTKIIREAMAHDDEQEYEASINYNTVDHTATIAIVNQMVKVRKLKGQ